MKRQDFMPELFLGKQKLEDGAEFEAFKEEWEEMSITPRPGLPSNRVIDTSSSCFTDFYEIRYNSLLHFGINMMGAQENRNRILEELERHNDNLAKEVEQSGERCSNISGVSNYSKFSSHIKLTSFEQEVIGNAVGNIRAEEGHNLALVDIFKRNVRTDKMKDPPVHKRVGGIDVDDLETHTILLYGVRNERDEGGAAKKILVIDPNSPMFSAFLDRYEISGVTLEALCSTKGQYKIYELPGGEKPGFGIDKYRDCVDIAVKLGMLLIEGANKGIQYATIADLMSSPEVKMVTNNPIIGEFNPIIGEQNVMRDKQTSELSGMENYNKTLAELSLKYTRELMEAEEEFERKQEKAKEEQLQKMEDSFNDVKAGIEGLIGDYTNYYDGDLE